MRPHWVGWVRALFRGVGGLAALAASSASAQQASPYVSLEDWWVTPYVEHLIRAGVILDPDPLTRPLRRGDVLAALLKADTMRASVGVRTTVRTLVAHLAPRGSSPVYRADLHAGVAVSTQARRDPLRAAGPSVNSYSAGLALSAAFGPFVLSTHPYYDRRLRFDPDYRGRQDLRVTGKVTDAYLGVQGRYAELTFGTVSRNWGPPGIDGVLVSSNPYAYDNLFARLGTPVVRIETMIAPLDDYVSPQGVRLRRWWAVHRFVGRPFRWLVGSLGEAALWQSMEPGPALWWLNPLKLASFTRDEESLPDSVNLALEADLRAALPHGVVVHGTLLVDDFDLSSNKLAPNRLGATLSADVPIGTGATARAYYTFISSLTYRTYEPALTIMRDSVGLGRNFSDYSQMTVTVSTMPWPMLIVTPEVTLLRQGQGDFRQPFPPLPATNVPFLFTGVVERTLRLAAGVRAQFIRSVDLDANFGWHFIANHAHVTGATATQFVGGIGLTYRLGAQPRVP